MPESIEFIRLYPKILSELKSIMRPEYSPVIDDLLENVDPHDLVRPDTYFIGRDQIFGFILLMVINRSKVRIG